MIKNRPLILVVNDDGIKSQGILILSSIMREIGEVFVVAPDVNRSGVSHAMTLNQDIYIENIDKEKNKFVCSGTPVDCVKLAINKVLPRVPDLCVSGINHGSNHSINGLYSGTLHGAMEATIQGIPSLSFSHLSYSNQIDFKPLTAIIKTMVVSVLNNSLPRGITLNVNFPDVDCSQIKGVKLCRQASGRWKEEFKLVKTNQLKSYYSISGEFTSDTKDIESDSWALENHFVSIVPTSIDYSYFLIDELNYLTYEF